MKKVIGLIFMLVIIIGVIITTIFIVNEKNEEDIKNNLQEIQKNKEDLYNKEKLDKDQDKENITNSKKTLVVYFSAQNHTKEIALNIAQNLDADIFSVEPKNIYTSEDLEYTNQNSRVYKEHNNPNLQNIELVNTNIENWDSYERVLIGYPIWWGEAAWPINGFIKSNDFANKEVIPFCTSQSSGIGTSAKNLEKLAKNAKFQEGIRFSSNASIEEITNFTNSLK